MIFESVGHLIFESLPKAQELCESVDLERFNVLVLLVQLAQRFVLKPAQAKRLVRPLSVDFLVEVVLSIVDSLHDVFLTLDSCLHLRVKTVLQRYKQSFRLSNKLTVESALCLVDGGVGLSDPISDLLVNGRLQLVEPLLRILEIISVVLAHKADFGLKLVFKVAQVGLEPVAECAQSVVQAFRLSLREVSVGLDLALDILEFGFELLLRLDPLHQHDFVVLVHLFELVVHVSEGHVVVLLWQVGLHIFFDEVAPCNEVAACFLIHIKN